MQTGVIRVIRVAVYDAPLCWPIQARTNGFIDSPGWHALCLSDKILNTYVSSEALITMHLWPEQIGRKQHVPHEMHQATCWVSFNACNVSIDRWCLCTGQDSEHIRSQ